MGRSRIGGIAAIAGGALGIVLTPAFTTGDDLYQMWGRLYAVAALLMLAGFIPFRSLLAGRLSATGRWGRTIASVGWIFFVVGIIGDYVLGDAMGEFAYNLSFLIEMLGVLALLVGYTLLGVSLRPTNIVPRWVTLLLMLTVPLGIAGVLLTGYLPSGPMSGVCVAMIAIGWQLCTAAERASSTATA